MCDIASGHSVASGVVHYGQEREAESEKSVDQQVWLNIMALLRSFVSWFLPTSSLMPKALKPGEYEAMKVSQPRQTHFRHTASVQMRASSTPRSMEK